MAFQQGVKTKQSQADIRQKLNSSGECLQNATSTLLLEMKVLNKLIYKSKNTHSKEKFFKCLERIKKCFFKWKLLNLDKKVITMSKSVCETENLCEVLNEIMLGGQLAIRIIILCQETVQYSLAYLSRGFFVTLHVILMSLLSRMWLLQKDCWTGLVECYQLVRSLIQFRENHINLNEFPKSLTSWLDEDVKGIFDGKCVDDAFSVVNSSNPIIQTLFIEKNDSDTPTMSNDEDNNDELDLGEPVQDTRDSEGKSRLYATPKLTNDKTVSNLKTNLTLKIDLESAGCKNVRENDLERAICNDFRENESSIIVEQNAKLEKLVEDGSLKDSHKIKARGKTTMSEELRKSDNKLVVRRLRRSVHRRENTYFIKKTSCRYTLRNLLTTRDFANCSMRRLRVLLKCLSFASREVLHSERKILSSIQSSLQKEFRERTLLKNRQKEDGISFLRKPHTHKECETPGIVGKTCTKGSEKCAVICCQRKDGQEFGTRRNVDSALHGVFRETCTREEGIICCQKNDEKPETKGAIPCCDPNEIFRRVSPIDLKCSMFSKETQNLQKDKERQSKKMKRDEIDDIFGSLDL